MNPEASVSNDRGFWLRMYGIVGAVLAIGLSSYFIAPMLPIYCVEEVSKGGLGWSRAEACSLYGTYLAVAHIAPFIGGVLADFIFGQTISTLLGYLFTAYGLSLLWFFPQSMFVPGFLLFGLGSGCVKVSLATAVGKMCSGSFAAYRTRAYDCHYFMSCLGFIAGNFFSSLFFDLWGMKQLFLMGFVMIFVSISLYLVAKPFQLQDKIEATENASIPQEVTPSWPILVGFFFVSVLFFACGNQLNSSLSLFLHKQVDRTFWGWSVPILWFSVFGFIVMTAFSSIRRKLWKPFEERVSCIECIKMVVGLAFLSLAFFFFFCASFFSGKWIIMTLVLVAMSVLYVADVHVRPLLFSSATKFSHPKYHTIAAALVYSTVGVGGKVAGTLAGTVDLVGFSRLFLLCAGIGAVGMILSLFLWKKQKEALSKKQLCPDVIEA